MTGDIHTLTVHDLAVDGRGIARLDTMAVFLNKGLPGETVRAQVTVRKKRFAEARVLETLTPSPDEIPSYCIYGGTCGGCAWTNLEYRAECTWKERQVKETLRRIGKMEFDGRIAYPPLVPSPKLLGYRNKMEFAFGPGSEGIPSLGLRKRGSHEIVSVEECPLSALSVRNILRLTREWLQKSALGVWHGSEGFCRFLVIRSPDRMEGEKRQCVVECITAPGQKREMAAVKELGEILLSEGGATGFVHSIRKNRDNVAYGERIVAFLGETVLCETVGHLTLRSPVQAFFQTNTAAATLLYEQIRAYAGPEPGTVWDIYCGTGGIGLYLAGKGVTLRGMETVPEAVRFAKQNAGQVSGDTAFFLGDAVSAFKALSPKPDIVITDPPRSGMGSAMVELLLRERPGRIITVSCDAASLARDIKELGQAYEVESVRAFDLFPHTPHVETVALLRLAT